MKRLILTGTFNMPNAYFRFQQFTIQQDACAMKVCTDACLFGAWVAERLKHTAVHRVLDIGTGTGLLGLMLAQQTNALIDAVEKNTAAAIQAGQNFEASPWKERLQIFNDDIATFNSNGQYQCIISNPPFYESDLKSIDAEKNAAKHDTTLTLAALIGHVIRLIDAKGIFAVLLPWRRTSSFITAATQAGLHLHQQTLVQQTTAHDYFRSMLLLGLSAPANIETDTLTIKNTDGSYTPAFTSLLKNYYLYLQ